MGNPPQTTNGSSLPAMRIVCISASQIPSDTANSIQVMKVCQAFTQIGHEVILLVPGKQPNGYLPIDLQKHYGLQTFFTIEWVKVRNRRQFPWVATQHARRLNADLVYAWPIQAATLGLLRRMAVMLELHDLPGGTFGPLWFELFLNLNGKKRLLPITKALLTAVEQKYRRLPDGQVVHAPDGVDFERYASLPDPATARRQAGLPSNPTVQCTGHLYEGRGAALFLSLAEKFPQASFVWVGGRPVDVENWGKKASAAALANVIFTGFVPNATIPLYQAAADVLLMPYQETVATSSGGNTASICSPMKMFEYMASGRAILTSDLPVLHEVLDDSMAIFCPPEDRQAWESALGELLADDHRRQALGQCARIRAEKYSWVKRAGRALAGFEIGTK
jgi:glycosyltransferase involved in cell wall biosynthesis